MTRQQDRCTPDARKTLNLSSKERELLHVVITAGVDHLSHEASAYDETTLREFQKEIISKLNTQSNDE
jgi:hypothetical protein